MNQPLNVTFQNGLMIHPITNPFFLLLCLSLWSYNVLPPSLNDSPYSQDQNGCPTT